MSKEMERIIFEICIKLGYKHMLTTPDCNCKLCTRVKAKIKD